MRTTSQLQSIVIKTNSLTQVSSSMAFTFLVVKKASFAKQKIKYYIRLANVKFVSIITNKNTDAKKVQRFFTW